MCEALVTILKTCDSSFENVDISNGGERARCRITFDAKESDYGAWMCKLQKCKDKKDGGCNAELGSECYKEIIINATVSVFKS